MSQLRVVRTVPSCLKMCLAISINGAWRAWFPSAAFAAAGLLLIATAALAASDGAEGGWWPEFHGPGRTNISSDTGLMKEWPEGGPPLLWRFHGCGRGYSGVSIAEGRIYTAGDFGRDEFVLALDLAGRLLWKARNGAAWHGPSPGSRTTPSYNDGVLYHMNPHGRLAAFDADRGKELWAVDLKERFDARFGMWGAAENVVVEGNKVLCMPGGLKGRVVALEKKTGETIWANTEIDDTAAYCSPIVVTHHGLRQLITMAQHSVLAVAVQTGKLLWSFPLVPRSPQNALTPVYRDGYVFVACGHWTGGTVLEISADSSRAEQVWFRRELDNCHGGSVLLGNKLFGSGCRSGGKQFYCVDFFTGRLIKELKAKELVKVGITCADGMLYCLNHQGTMSLIKVTPDGFEVVSQFSLGRRPPNTYLAHPVVCGGRLYIRHACHLSVYDVRDRSRVRAGG